MQVYDRKVNLELLSNQKTTINIGCYQNHSHKEARILQNVNIYENLFSKNPQISIICSWL